VFVRGVFEGLRALDGIEVVPVAKPGSARALDVGRKSLPTRLRNAGAHLRFYADRLQREANRLDCDVIFCPTPLVPLRGRIPTVVTLFDLSPLRVPQTLDWMSRQYLRAMVGLGVRRARGVCTISQAVAGEIRAHFGRLHPDQVFVAYPGASPELLAGPPEPIPSLDQPFALMVGTVEPRKNHLTVLRAFAAHLGRNPGSPLQLIIAGSLGWRYGPILEAVGQLGLRERVRIDGAVSPGRLNWLYRYARALLFPSLYEGFGLPVLEAFALECPVVAARIPPVIELAGEGRALLLDPLDVAGWSGALDRVATGTLDGTMPAAGLARSREFTWEACARQVLAGLRRAVTVGP